MFSVWKMQRVKNEYCFGTIPLQKDRIFLVLHKKGNYWGLPKGHLEQGETPELAAQRELQEETALCWRKKLANHTFIETYQFDRNGEWIEKRVEYFLVEVEGQANVAFEDVLSGDWFTWEEAIAKVTFEGNRKVLKKAFELIQNMENGDSFH